MAGSDMVLSVIKALDILRLVAESPDGLRLGDVLRATGLKKTTAHNLMRTLCARGFIEKTGGNRFVLGPAPHELVALRSRNLRLQVAERQLRRLHAMLPKATLTFSELTPSAIHCRLRVSPDRPGEIQRPLDRQIMPYVTQTALCLQATSANASSFERHYPFEEYGVVRWRTLQAFMEHKQRVRERGYAIDLRPDRLAIAFPVPDTFALGFSVENPPPDPIHELSGKAAEFCCGMKNALTLRVEEKPV